MNWISRTASAIINDIRAGLVGYKATETISLEQLEDEVVEERLAAIKKASTKNMLPLKDLMYSINCIPLDCQSLDKCCDKSDFSKPVAHFEIPQTVNDFGKEAIAYIGSTDKQISFTVYTGFNFKYHKYKTRRKNKPYVFIDTTPNENNMYDGYVFNAPWLERISVVGIFKDPRQLEQFACCNDIEEEPENLTWLTTEIKDSLINKKLKYYRQLYPQTPTINNQIPQ